MKYPFSCRAARWVGSVLLSLALSVSAAQSAHLRSHSKVVTTSPSLGLRTLPSLEVNLPRTNEDLRLLNQRKHSRQAVSSQPVIELSGDLVAQAFLENKKDKKE